MRNNKRLAALMMVSALSVQALTGCSSTAGGDLTTEDVIWYSSDEATTEQTTDEASTPEETTEKVTKEETKKETQKETEASTEAPTEPETTTPEETTETEAPTTTVAPTTTTPPETQDELAGLTAVAQVPNYVNVRTEPNTSSDIVGMIYNNCAATVAKQVEGEDGLWYYIQSGKVIGYIKAEFFVVGEEAEQLRETIGKLKAVVTQDYLRVRSTPSLDDLDNVVTQYRLGTEVAVVGYEGDFAKIETDASSTGYVHMSCIDIWREFDVAITVEEDAARKAEQARREQEALEAQKNYELQLQQLRESKEAQEAHDASVAQSLADAQAALQAQQQAALLAQQQSAIDASVQQSIAESQNQAYLQALEASRQQSIAESSMLASQDPNAALRNAIVAFARQFEGRPYVHGGRSLTNGTDCSGFTNLVYMNFGKTLDWTPAGQSNLGPHIPWQNARPGDLVFYSNSVKYLGHVALYIGNGQIIHACNETYGICIWPVNYREPLFAVSVLG